MNDAAERWGEALRSWAIPQEILDAAPESPWGFPVECFRVEEPSVRTPTHRAVAEVLPGNGSLIDVGCGGGGASLPLAPSLSQLVAVDEDAGMLEDLRRAAAIANPDLDVVTVRGTWPCRVPIEAVDVAVCANVLYNVADVSPFLAALESICTLRVVLEITAMHPVAWMNDLWMRFHGLTRPATPTAADAIAVIEGTGATVHSVEHPHIPVFSGFADRQDAIAFIRRRLCLPASEDARIAESLGDLLAKGPHGWHVGPESQESVTLWWEPRGR